MNLKKSRRARNNLLALNERNAKYLALSRQLKIKGGSRC